MEGNAMSAAARVMVRSIYVPVLLAISVPMVSTGVAVIHPVRATVPGTVHVFAAGAATTQSSGIGWD
jgi:hypothetical protein